MGAFVISVALLGASRGSPVSFRKRGMSSLPLTPNAPAARIFPFGPPSSALPRPVLARCRMLQRTGLGCLLLGFIGGAAAAQAPPTFPGELIPTGSLPSALVLADFNGDGATDVAAANSGEYDHRRDRKRGRPLHDHQLCRRDDEPLEATIPRGGRPRRRRPPRHRELELGVEHPHDLDGDGGWHVRKRSPRISERLEFSPPGSRSAISTATASSTAWSPTINSARSRR